MRKGFVICMILIATFSLFGAQKSSLKASGGLHFLVGMPEGEFEQHLDDPGFGLDLNVGVMPNRFVAIGGAFGFMVYGSETRREPISYTIPDVTVEVTRTNNFMFGDIYMQAIGDLTVLKPYIEGRLGFSYLWTETRISDLQGDDEDIASSTNIDDFTWRYGGGGGLMVLVWEDKSPDKGDPDDPNNVYIDIKAIYTRGGNAEYLKEGGVEIDDGVVIYHLEESTTDLFSLSFGVAVGF